MSKFRFSTMWNVILKDHLTIMYYMVQRYLKPTKCTSILQVFVLNFMNKVKWSITHYCILRAKFLSPKSQRFDLPSVLLRCALLLSCEWHRSGKPCYGLTCHIHLTNFNYRITILFNSKSMPESTFDSLKWSSWFIALSNKLNKIRTDNNNRTNLTPAILAGSLDTWYLRWENAVILITHAIMRKTYMETYLLREHTFIHITISFLSIKFVREMIFLNP